MSSFSTSPLARLYLVLGGARSGKSRYAEQLIEQSGLAPIYIATAEALDKEMTERIAKHRVRRSRHWRTIEEPLSLIEVLDRAAAQGSAILVDCLTLWLTNLMVHDKAIAEEIDALIDSLDRQKGTIVFVSNEVGQGVTPTNAMARAFIDHAGLLHQKMAEKADCVLFMTAGLPRQLKP